MVLAVCYFQFVNVTYFLRCVNCQCFDTYYAPVPCLSCRGLIATCFVGTGWKDVIEKSVVRRYVTSAGVCLLLQL